MNPPSSSGLTSAAPARFSEATTSGQGGPAPGWGTPKQPQAASSTAPQPSSLAPGGPSQSMGSSLLSSLQVGTGHLAVPEAELGCVLGITPGKRCPTPPDTLGLKHVAVHQGESQVCLGQQPGVWAPLLVWHEHIVCRGLSAELA